MKLLLLPFAAALSGLAWLAGGPSNAPSATSATDDPCTPCPSATSSPADDCKVDVECTSSGTCVITCENGQGETCVIELACSEDGDCEVVRCEGTPCEAPCR